MVEPSRPQVHEDENDVGDVEEQTLQEPEHEIDDEAVDFELVGFFRVELVDRIIAPCA